MARLLIDRGELHTRHGRVMIGITLVEDLAVVILIVLMPALGALGDRAPAGRRGRAVQAAPSWYRSGYWPSRVMPRS